MVTTNANNGLDVWEEFKKEIHEELEQVRSELEEIDLMMEQSQFEVGKLAQRNASVNAQLQQIQNQFDSMPREDIRIGYDAALDAQQRLFVMRGQVEKLQSDQAHLKRYETVLARVEDIISGGARSGKTGASKATVETLEMMIEAQEAERQRLSRQMHDGPAQALSNFILQTEIAMRLFELDQAKAKDELVQLKTAATSTFQQVREFIFELRPMMLDDLGLAPTIKRYVDAVKDQANGTDISLDLTGVDRRLEPYQEVLIFRAIQELLANAVRHSHATQINLQVDLGETNVRITMDDNGSGFDVGVIEERSNMGIKVIRERVEMIGGYLELDSIVGKGTRVSFQIPAAQVARLT